MKTIIYLTLCIILISITQGCGIFSCGTDETLNLCEQILRNPDSLDSIAKNNNVSSVSDLTIGTRFFRSLPETKKYIKDNFSNGFLEPKCSIPRDRLLVYDYYGSYYNNPKTNSYERAFIRIGFINISGSWKLIGILNYNPDTNNPYPPDHGDMIVE